MINCFSAVFKTAQDKTSAQEKNQMKAEHYFFSNLCLTCLCSRIKANNLNGARCCISEFGWGLKKRIEPTLGISTCILKYKYFRRRQHITNVIWTFSWPERGQKESCY